MAALGRSREEAAEWLARQRAFYASAGFGFWRAELRADGAFAGYCGIRPLDVKGLEGVEVGWNLRRALWGRGLATEAARGVLDLAFGRYGAGRVIALIVAENAASRRVAEKAGMTRAGGGVVVEGRPYLVYERTAQSASHTPPYAG